MFRIAAAIAFAFAADASRAQAFEWSTIVNNGFAVPDTSGAKFHAYNQPAVNAAGMVVFRARGKPPSEGGEAPAPSGEEQMIDGVYLRDMSGPGPITRVARRGNAVPAPNNTSYNGQPAGFKEFPSTPRIDASSSFIATRGQSQPVYTYLAADGVTQTRIGTSGVYANPGGVLTTGASLLGSVKEVQADSSYALSFPYVSVPDGPPGTRFDQFPGSPTATNASIIAFKGNWTDPSDGAAKTGVYYRDVVAAGGKAPTYLVASSNTVIPNQGGAVRFGSTAPPSAANGYIAFTGWDNEDAPTMGGVYRAPIMPGPSLQKLAAIGDPVPGEAQGATFRNFGEVLSMSEDGRYVAFWGSWGSEAASKTLLCPDEGNKARLAYCLETLPAGLTVQIPVHQGIFVADAQSGLIIPIAKTGEQGITDFVYWVYSGAPPGVGGSEDGSDESREPPRWRSSAFVALASKPGHVYGSSLASSPFQVAFKARRSGVDGIYLRRGDINTEIEPVVETYLTPGQAVDPAAPANSIVTAVAIERDGFRDDNLAVAVSMLYETVDTSLGWAGLYLAKVRPVDTAHHADLSITQSTATDSVVFGSEMSFTLTVTNAGPDPATDVVVRDDLPPGSTIVSASPGCEVEFHLVSCQIGSLAMGASANLVMTVLPGVGNALTNSADVRGRQADISTANNSSSKTVQVTAGLAASLLNVSTRAQVLTGEDVQIVGFIIRGSSNKTVVVSGLGPSLTSYGVVNPVRDPTLTLVRMSDHAVIATNDDWGTAANAAQLAATGFAPASPYEPSILISLPPGAYTAILSGKTPSDTGIGVAAVYEVDHAENELVNISSRGRIAAGGEAVMIAGFIVQGTGRQLVVVRAFGPSLAEYGVSSPSPNVAVTLVRMSDGQVIAENDDWQVNNTNRNAIEQRGFAPASPVESAIMLPLDPGAYTAVVRGLPGVAVVGVDSLPEENP